jgi:heme-degrading monooxygenase HmoA
MFVTMNHVPATAETGQALEARFAHRQRLVDRMPGFRSFEVLRPLTGPSHGAPRGSEYLVVTGWDDRASFEAWVNSGQQRPVRPAAAGRLSAADAGSWPTMHESCETAYSPGWPSAAQQAAPIAVLNIVDVAHDFERVYEEVFRTREGSVEQQPGFLSLEVLRTVSGGWDGPEADARRAGTTYVVFSRWASAEAHDAWTRSEAFRRAHGRRRLPEGAVLKAGIRAFSIVQQSYSARAAEGGRQAGRPR